MVSAQDLHDYCDGLLAASQFDDYCPNGLQVEAGGGVSHLVTGVTASQALIDAAAREGADAILVHHGYFWKGESPCIRGMKGRRIAALLGNGISLFAYHLPLDAHPDLGNNRQLARVLDFLDPRPVDERRLVWEGRLSEPQPLNDLARRVSLALGREPMVLAGSERPVERIAWCTGAAQGAIEQAAALGVDAYLSGEVSEQTLHQARELGVHYLAAGHHATERYGVQALGAHLAERFGIHHQYIEVPNPA